MQQPSKAPHYSTASSNVSQQSNQTLTTLQEPDILSKQKLQELMNQIASGIKLDTEVEEVLIDIAEDFIESTTSFACELAKHRKSNTLEVKDLQFHLERNYNIKIPGNFDQS